MNDTSNFLTGISKIGPQSTFEDFSKWWLKRFAERTLRERTIERFHQFESRTYLALGAMPINTIKAIHIQMFLESLEEEGTNCRTGGGLSAKTIRGYLNFISDILKFAWRLEFIETNPCERVMPPPLRKEEPTIYTETQTAKFLVCLRDAPVKYQTFFSIAIFAGLRRGELLGLTWNDIDFDNCIIKIQRNLQYTKRKGMYFEDPKTNAGNRVLKMTESLFTLIKQLRREQVIFCRDKGYRWLENRTIFINAIGDPMHPNTPYNWLRRFCVKHELPFYGIHQFRHLNASLLISDGTDPRTVAYALGHAQVTTTLNIYSHAFAYSQAKASAAVADRLEEKINTHDNI